MSSSNKKDVLALAIACCIAFSPTFILSRVDGYSLMASSMFGLIGIVAAALGAFLGIAIYFWIERSDIFK